MSLYLSQQGGSNGAGELEATFRGAYEAARDDLDVVAIFDGGGFRLERIAGHFKMKSSRVPVCPSRSRRLPRPSFHVPTSTSQHGSYSAHRLRAPSTTSHFHTCSHALVPPPPVSARRHERSGRSVHHVHATHGRQQTQQQPSPPPAAVDASHLFGTDDDDDGDAADGQPQKVPRLGDRGGPGGGGAPEGEEEEEDEDDELGAALDE
eukprot:105483-Chlamydomonas_euryale.AAC.1